MLINPFFAYIQYLNAASSPILQGMRVEELTSKEASASKKFLKITLQNVLQTHGEFVCKDMHISIYEEYCPNNIYLGLIHYTGVWKAKNTQYRLHVYERENDIQEVSWDKLERHGYKKTTCPEPLASFSQTLPEVFRSFWLKIRVALADHNKTLTATYDEQERLLNASFEGAEKNQDWIAVIQAMQAIKNTLQQLVTLSFQFRHWQSVLSFYQKSTHAIAAMHANAPAQKAEQAERPNLFKVPRAPAHLPKHPAKQTGKKSGTPKPRYDFLALLRQIEEYNTLALEDAGRCPALSRIRLMAKIVTDILDAELVFSSDEFLYYKKARQALQKICFEVRQYLRTVDERQLQPEDTTNIQALLRAFWFLIDDELLGHYLQQESTLLWGYALENITRPHLEGPVVLGGETYASLLHFFATQEETPIRQQQLTLLLAQRPDVIQAFNDEGCPLFAYFLQNKKSFFRAFIKPGEEMPALDRSTLENVKKALHHYQHHPKRQVLDDHALTTLFQYLDKWLNKDSAILDRGSLVTYFDEMEKALGHFIEKQTLQGLLEDHVLCAYAKHSLDDALEFNAQLTASSTFKAGHITKKSILEAEFAYRSEIVQKLKSTPWPFSFDAQTCRRLLFIYLKADAEQAQIMSSVRMQGMETLFSGVKKVFDEATFARLKIEKCRAENTFSVEFGQQFPGYGYANMSASEKEAFAKKVQPLKTFLGFIVIYLSLKREMLDKTRQMETSARSSSTNTLNISS